MPLATQQTCKPYLGTDIMSQMLAARERQCCKKALNQMVRQAPTGARRNGNLLCTISRSHFAPINFLYLKLTTCTHSSSRPDIVTIMLGTNDAKTFNWEGVQMNLGDFYALDYMAMIKILREELSPVPQVFVMIPPPLYKNSSGQYPFYMNGTVINEIFPTLIPNIGAVSDCTVISIFDAILSSDFPQQTLTCDGCHPTAAADQIIADTILPYILQAAKTVEVDKTSRIMV